MINHLIVKTLPLVPKKIMYLVARNYIVGPRPEDAVQVTRRLNACGIRATINVLGESIRTLDAAAIPPLTQTFFRSDYRLKQCSDCGVFS